jgi:hypothetical protein
MNADDIKNKAAETMSNAKDKVEAIAADERVQKAKASALKCIIDAKDWVVSNWKSPGWRGKAKVVAAVIVAFFFCRGVFCGWGASQNAGWFRTKSAIGSPLALKRRSRINASPKNLGSREVDARYRAGMMRSVLQLSIWMGMQVDLIILNF